LHKKNIYNSWLIPYFKLGGTGKGVDLRDKIKATDFYQKKGKEISNVKI